MILIGNLVTNLPITWHRLYTAKHPKSFSFNFYGNKILFLKFGCESFGGATSIPNPLWARQQQKIKN
jgi:hypothetical protein